MSKFIKVLDIPSRVKGFQILHDNGVLHPPDIRLCRKMDSRHPTKTQKHL